MSLLNAAVYDPRELNQTKVHLLIYAAAIHVVGLGYFSFHTIYSEKNGYINSGHAVCKRQRFKLNKRRCIYKYGAIEV